MKYFMGLFIFLTMVFYLYGGKNKSSEVVYVENLYATSTRMPEVKYSVYNLFDTNKKNCWQTMKGAGPDEGVFLEFRSPTYIDRLDIVAPETLQSYPNFKLYINGVETKSYSFDDCPILIGKKVKTFYLRSIEGLLGFKKSNSIVIRDISFYGKGNLLKLVLPKQVPGRIVASSSLAPVESYNVDFLFDSRVDFGWADGNPRKTGVGEKLCFDFDKKVTIDKIKLWNGYQRSANHYSANERVRNFRFGLKGSKGQLYYMRDRKISYIKLKKPLTGKSFVFNVSRIYRGAKYKDLVISEMRFFYRNQSFIPKTGNVERRKKKLIAKVKRHKILSKILDRRLSYERSGVSTSIRQSLILRSNGSFVLWLSDDNSEASITRYADGNWQLMKNNRLKIFGRIHRIDNYYNTKTTYYDPYGGRQMLDDKVKKVDVNSIKIFHDYLLLNRSQVRSKKGLFRSFPIR